MWLYKMAVFVLYRLSSKLFWMHGMTSFSSCHAIATFWSYEYDSAMRWSILKGVLLYFIDCLLPKVWSVIVIKHISSHAWIQRNRKTYVNPKLHYIEYKTIQLHVSWHWHQYGNSTCDINLHMLTWTSNWVQRLCLKSEYPGWGTICSRPRR